MSDREKLLTALLSEPDFETGLTVLDVVVLLELFGAEHRRRASREAALATA